MAEVKINKNKSSEKTGDTVSPYKWLAKLSLGLASWRKTKLIPNKKYLWFGLFGVLSATNVYFYAQWVSIKKDPNKTAVEENQKLIAHIGKLIILPEGESPTIATVSDPEKLKDQAFFANARRGDKLLLYPSSKKAFLYNPTYNKIVDIAPITIGSSAKKPEISTPSESLEVEMPSKPEPEPDEGD